MPAETEELKRDYETIDREIDAGHAYAGIFISLPYAKDEFQRKDMEITLQALYENSRYIRAVVDEHSDPISFLAGRGPSYRHGSNRSNRILEQSESCV